MYWPKKKLLTMLEDDTTQPNLTDFLPQPCKVLERNISLLIEAENRVAYYQSISDSEGTLGKKKRIINSTPKTQVGAYILDESLAISKPKTQVGAYNLDESSAISKPPLRPPVSLMKIIISHCITFP